MPTLKLKPQIFRGDEIAIGPGKAALIDAIEAHGSISAAARTLGMSYRRAWHLADTLNRCFDKRVVDTRPGGGARITAEGKAVAAAYRALVERAAPPVKDASYRQIAAAVRRL